MPIQDPLTGLIIGRCFRVANELGPGFLEKVYENALAFELREAKVNFVQQQSIVVFYRGAMVGRYQADLTVEGSVIVEVKAVQALDSAHVAQCLNDRRGTGLMTCLLVNFGRAKTWARFRAYGESLTRSPKRCHRTLQLCFPLNSIGIRKGFQQF
jgi:GxxExxY protein